MDNKTTAVCRAAVSENNPKTGREDFPELMSERGHRRRAALRGMESDLSAV